MSAQSADGRASKLAVIAVVLGIYFAAAGLGLALGADEVESTDAGRSTDSAAALSAPPRETPGVEIKDKRTATSETFRLPSGAFETRIYENPIHYRDAGGEWRPIEEGLRPESDSALSNGANDFDIDLPSRMGAGPVRLSADGEWVAYELLGQATDAALVKGSVASYRAADPGVTFELSSLPNGIKEDIEIAGPEEPSTFHFQLTASPGVKPDLLEDGSIHFKDEGGETIALLPAPLMSDSTPRRPRVSEDIHYSLEPEGAEGWRLILEADEEWLADTERNWPVTLDPTLTVPSPTLDCTYGYYGDPRKVWGECGSAGYQKLYATYAPEPTEDGEGDRSAIRFDLSSIPTGVHIADATLGLYAPNASWNTTGVQIRQATKTWTGGVDWWRYDGLTNWTMPGGDYTSSGTEVLTSERGSQAGWWNFANRLDPPYANHTSLMTLVRKWHSKQTPNQGFIVKLREDWEACLELPCPDSGVVFNSSAAADASKRPYLAVSYYTAAPSTSTVTSPKEGTQTGSHLTLKAAWATEGTTGVTFQVKPSGWPSFFNVPADLVRKADGQPVTWPMPVQGKQSDEFYFDVSSFPGLSDWGSKLQIRALFDGSSQAAGYSAPVNAVWGPMGGNLDATTPVGPGSLDLVTGGYTISRTDVSIPVFDTTLEFSRSFSSLDRERPDNVGPLGTGWKPSTPVETAGAAIWSSLRDASATEEGPFVVLKDLEGYETAFEEVNGSYVAPPEATGWTLTKENGVFVLADPTGTRTIFEKGIGSEYLPAAVSQLGGPDNKTQMVYGTDRFGNRQIQKIIAPSASGVICNESNATTTIGCRSLTFSYEEVDIGSFLVPRLVSITYHGPSGPTTQGHWEVSRYAYNASGRLIAQWDPRVSPALKETYAYHQVGYITTVTPPGEEPWSLEYDSFGGLSGRLKAVRRATLLSNPSVAQTSIVYDVPLSGGAAPYDMGPSAITQWGQKDLPVDATAVFPPDQIPSDPPSSYSRATVYYMDATGQLVNTATPSGAGTSAPSITTTETDEHGNVVRELTAQNRLRALAAGTGSILRSHELETKRVFNFDGTEMEEEWGPLHETRLESGSIVLARTHRVVAYDEGLPESSPNPNPHLPTSETVGASIAGQSVDADQRLTETKYDWSLRKPTHTIIDPGGLALTTRTVYDAVSGLPIERRLPANPNGGDARTTKFRRYTAGPHPLDSSCGNSPAWANLPCKVLPAAQPSGSGQPELLVRTFWSYSPLGQPIRVLESPPSKAGDPRESVTTYDDAGRVLTTRQSGESAGTPIPKIEAIYSSTTGRPVAQRFKCETSCEGFDNQIVTATYDTLGRQIAYEDADGNTSTTSYDFLGRPTSTFDGKGTQTFGYDATSGLLVSLTDSTAGTFTASYDADGNLVEQLLPNGLAAQTTHDETGAPVHLKYQKTTNCLLQCTWLEFDVEESIHGQWLAQTSTLSSQQYSYDKAGRLTLVKDTPQGGGCTTAPTHTTPTRTARPW